jgi:hypothetical protein
MKTSDDFKYFTALLISRAKVGAGKKPEVTA